MITGNDFKIKKGAALYLSILVLGLLLLIGASLSFIFSLQFQTLKTEEEIKIAEGAADSGIEDGLYTFYVTNEGEPNSFDGTTNLSNGSSANYEGYSHHGCPGRFCIDSTGVYHNVTITKKVILY